MKSERKIEKTEHHNKLKEKKLCFCQAYDVVWVVCSL